MRRPDAFCMERLGAVVTVMYFVRIIQRDVYIQILFTGEGLQTKNASVIIYQENIFNILVNSILIIILF